MKHKFKEGDRIAMFAVYYDVKVPVVMGTVVARLPIFSEDIMYDVKEDICTHCGKSECEHAVIWMAEQYMSYAE